MSVTDVQSSPPAPTPPAPSPTPTPPPNVADPPKPVEPPKVTAPAPFTAESLKLPDGVTLDKPLVDKFVGIMNDANLDRATLGQKLVELQVEAMKAVHEGGNKQWDDLTTRWGNEIKADPIIGGDKLTPALGNIAKLIDTFSTDKDGKPDPAFAKDFRDALDLTGMGNNPKMVRFLHNIAQVLVAEGKPVQGTPAATSGDPASLLYPTMKVA